MKTLRYLNFNPALAGLLLMFAFTATSLAQVPAYYNYNTAGGNNSFPFGISTGKMLQSIFLPGDFNTPGPAPAGLITKFYYRINETYPMNNITYTSFYITMGRTALTSLPTGAFYTGTLDTVYKRASVLFNAAGGTFLMITLDTPFLYDPTMSLVVEIGQCGFTGGANFFPACNQTLTGNRRSYSVGGCPFAYFGQGAQICAAGVDIAPPSARNRALLLPTPGVNTNYVMIPHQGSMIGFPNLTIEGWVKTGNVATIASTVLNKGGASFDYQFGISAGGIPFFRLQGVVAASTGFIVTDGIWTHVAATFDGTTVRFYKDGALLSTVPLASTPGSSVNEMRIGRGNADPGSGNIEELRLWSVARTQIQIDSNKCKKWRTELTSTTGLKAIWHFDSTYTDSVNSYNGTPIGTVGFDTVSYPVPGANCNLVGVTHNQNEIPAAYNLGQNYPNPFNPSTTIKFAIPKGGFVEIKLYDLLGREVQTLVQDPFEAGVYSVTFDASKLSSGVYFYKITAGTFTDSKKMLLIK